MNKLDPDSKGVNSIETAIEILDYVADRKEARISQIAQDIGVAKSTVHRHLYTLKKHRLIGKEADHYYLGLGLLKFGEMSRCRKAAYQEAGVKVQELAEQSGERSQFVVEEEGYGVYVHGARGDHGVKTNPRIGKQLPLHATATGKAILAYSPVQTVERVIERGLDQFTEHTITDAEELHTELDQIRQRGYSYNDQENIWRLRAVGVPIKRPNGTVIGALSISGPIKRFQGEMYEETVPKLLLGNANELEINIEHIGD